MATALVAGLNRYRVEQSDGEGEPGYVLGSVREVRPDSGVSIKRRE